ncbi:tyrosine-type recombinase/integrase [Pseudohoeflea coraliihabitans]|uniref:Tyrosine-type recombinase/integrase n=1 Tax=Pseudohoeflea coraliihabitans TaxID=2860393 RepID=A0ABS6WP37_9HYPH|nr:site-specific integrase [Pseudohoeflea sp. DP4N28-3]MBW3097726.1 tyrosine-type recombinase/integrase [Pseudohoeflea sp. DP4N28-3]
MPRAVHKLSDVQCRTASRPGLLGDGGGLYLNIKTSGSRSWVFVWRSRGKRSEMGLGPYPTVSLAKARRLAAVAREAVQEGRNPIAEKRKTEEPSFGECMELFLSSMEHQWRNDKHRAQWRATLTTYAKPLHGKKPSEIGTDDVLQVLSPIWQEIPETASRLRGRIERVLDFAKARGWRSGENVAAWRGHLKNVLPSRQKLTRGHHAAIAHQDVPSFMAILRNSEAMAARALEFLILTAARSGEVISARWDEIDRDQALWIVPASRMKAGREHRVPLSDRALEILDDLHPLRQSEFVFPGAKPGRPLSPMAMQMLMRRLGQSAYTVHGFRSSFRDWAGDATSFPREVAEQALAHRVGDATERAYRRADALSKRRRLMEAWGTWCSQTENKGKVVVLNANN